MGTFEICWENKKYSFHWCCILFFNFRTDAFQFPLNCALVSVRRADKKVLPATLPLTDQLLLRARRTELNFYGQGGNSFHHTLRYGHIGHTPNANPLGVIQQLRGPILTTSPPRVDNCGHFTYYLTFVHVTKRGLSNDPSLLVHVVIEWPLKSSSFLYTTVRCHCSCQLMSFSLLQFLVLIEILSSSLLQAPMPSH